MMVKACRELNATRIQCFCHVLHSSINIDIESSSSGCINRDSDGAGSKSMTVLSACCVGSRELSGISVNN